MNRSRHPSGMVGFSLVWFGQVVSMIGSTMTGFALSIWAYQETGQATTLALMQLAYWGPTVFLSPLAGALVDRWNRKRVMMLSDLGAGVATAALATLHLTGSLEIWHIYAVAVFGSAFQAFQFPAYSAAITTMIPKQHYTRANGMMSIAESGSGIIAPILAGILVGVLGIGSIFLIDLATFGIALITLALVFIPQPAETEAGRASRGSLWQESLFGFRYIFARPSLLGVQLVFMGLNLTGGLTQSIQAAMILARTGNSAATLGTVMSAVSVGGVVGGLLMSTWGGTKRRVNGILLAMALEGVIGVALMGMGQSLPVWLVAGFMTMVFISVLNAHNQALWMAKVAPEVQGRVFATRRLIAQLLGPAAALAAGPLADKVFEPAMATGGSLAGLFGGLVGTGPGAGMGLMHLLFGLTGTAIALAAFSFRAIREADTLLPDHDQPAPGSAMA